MKFTIILLTCFFHGLNSKEKYLRIFGGREAVEGEYPYIVRMLIQESVDDIPGEFGCTCSVLTKRWTLTAAHCVIELEHDTAVIEYKNSHKSETAYSKVMYMVWHHDFSVNQDGGSNDIALLKTQPVLVAKYGKLSSLDYTTLYGQQVVIVGYGMINSTSLATIPHIPHVLEAIAKECEPATSYPAICYAVLCSTQKNIGKAICPGDSGGPTVHASGIVGISVLTDPRDCDMYVSDKIHRRELYHKGYNMGESLATISYIDWISSVMKNKTIQIMN